MNKKEILIQNAQGYKICKGTGRQVGEKGSEAIQGSVNMSGVKGRVVIMLDRTKCSSHIRAVL